MDRKYRIAWLPGDGIGKEVMEAARIVLDHYQQTKNLLVSYSPKKLGFF